MIIYQFKCICGATYVGRTTRQLSKRIKEHQPRWLRLGGRGVVSSSIVAHLLESGHSIEAERSFTIIYRVPMNGSKASRFRTLAMAEAISIRLLKPELCSQRNLCESLNLPWPTVEAIIHEDTRNPGNEHLCHTHTCTHTENSSSPPTPTPSPL